MNETEAITALFGRYAKALNDSDTDAVMELYSADGVFMPQHFPSSVGATAVRQAYERVFQAIQLTVEFHIEEIQSVSPDWAFARTNSAGTVFVHSTGESSAEANQELFVLHKVEGKWKIARYCFSTTNPPRV
jgi:uncharacterized protein (TIGR02246 family)